MQLSQRIVTRIPLRELWNDEGLVPLSRSTPTTAAEIQELLRAGPVSFVVADVGFPLRWVPLRDCFQFWKDEARPHLADGDRLVPEACPGEYCYAASRWEPSVSPTAGGPPVILLEKHH